MLLLSLFRITPFSLLLMCIPLGLAADSINTSSPDADLQKVKNQTFKRLLDEPEYRDLRIVDSRKHPGAEGWMASLGPDGRWPDIDYTDQTRGAWKLSAHPHRLIEMARAYRDSGSPLNGNPALLAAIQRALDHWLAQDYLCPNWWHNEIGVPQDMGSTLILMSNALTTAQIQGGVEILKRARIGMTGQNRVWLAGNVLMRGLIENDPRLVQAARDAMDEEFVTTTGEGLQVDFSFHQHGPQLQIGNYGLAFARSLANWLESLRETRYAFSPEKVNLLRRYALAGSHRVVWKERLDISACGRQLFPNAPAGKALTVQRLLEQLREIDPLHSAEYEAALAGNDPTGCGIFWRSDFLVDRRSDYYASLKMSSLRTIGNECVNDENLAGNLLGDGVLLIYRSGREYENLFPVWDWHRLPGVTTSRHAPLRPSKDRNASSFVGGVTDGRQGLAVLDYDRHGLRAKKSAFFFPDRIVCLGAGIHSEAAGSVTTSINQSQLNGPIRGSLNGPAISLPLGEEKTGEWNWLWHDGTGYVFPEPQSVTVRGADQAGNWQSVFRAGSANPTTTPIFSAWINHGENPSDNCYSYVIFPGADEAQTRAFSEKPEIQILQNTPALQAVRKGQTTGAVFYQAGEIECFPDLTLAVDQPCVILAQAGANGPQLHVADPTQSLATLSVKLGKAIHLIQLPTGAEAGRSVSVPLQP